MKDRKEYLLNAVPDIESLMFSTQANDILDAMDEYAADKLNEYNKV